LAPHRKAVVYRIATMPPRKPNSAKRTFAKVRLNFSGRRLFAKIPGIGDSKLQAHSLVFFKRAWTERFTRDQLSFSKGTL